MRKSVFLVIVLVVCLGFASAVAFAASWKQVAASASTEYSFDTASLKYITLDNGEKVIEVWIYGSLRQVQADGTKNFTQKWWLRLDQKMTAVRAEYRYDMNGNVISSNTQNGTWSETVPGTTGERIHEVVTAYCERNL